MLTSIQSQERVRDALVKVGGTPAGQRVLAWVIYNLAALEDGAPLVDSHQILIHEGRRSVGRLVLNELRQIDNELGTSLERLVHEIRYDVPVTPARQEKSSHG